MQYPIIDSLTNAYIRNGWTGLNISTGKNLFGGVALKYAILNNIPNSVLDETNETVSYTGANALQRKIISGIFKENTQYTIILNGYNSSTNTQTPNMRVEFTDGSTPVLPNFVNGISIYQSPANKTISQIAGEYVTSTTYLYYNNCGVFEGVISADDFEEYNPTTDVKNRLKLPMIYYFPHPVIDAIISASDGQQTAEETEILRHYLTPLGIGGI